MAKIWNLSKSFLKKNWKDTASFCLILFMASALFNAALSTVSGVEKAYEDKFRQLNTADLFVNIPEAFWSESLAEDLENIEGVEQLENRPGTVLSVPVNMDGSSQEQNLAFYLKDDKGNLSKYQTVMQMPEEDSGIYLSNYTWIHSGLEPGGAFEFETDGRFWNFPVCGVLEEMQFGNYSSSLIPAWLTDDEYSRLKEAYPEKQIRTLLIKAEDGALMQGVQQDVLRLLSNQSVPVLLTNTAENSKGQRMAVSSIIVMILLVFALMILAVSLFITRYKIKEFIENERANMGVLKALGYTSSQIVWSVILPYISMGLLAVAAGVIMSWMIVPVLASLIEMQSGMIWKPGIDWLAGIMCLTGAALLLCAFAWFCACGIYRLHPVQAIRNLKPGGSQKVRFEFENTAGSLNGVMILKNFAGSISQNVVLGAVLFLMTLVLSFVLTLYVNVNVSPMNFINTLVEEHPDVIVRAEEGKAGTLRSSLRAREDVKQALFYDQSQKVKLKDTSALAFVSERFDGLANDLCYEGENPAADHEAAVGSWFVQEYGLNIGDVISLEYDGRSEDFIISGFVQSVNNSGQVIELTQKGFERLAPDWLPSDLYVYLKDPQDAAFWIDAVENTYADRIASTMNYAQSMDSAMVLYLSVIRVLCAVSVLGAAALILLVLYILISSMILKRKLEFGISRAMGFTSMQLMGQLAGGLLPGTLLAAVCGFVCSRMCMQSVYTAIFQGVGAMKVSFDYPLILYGGCALAVICVSMLIALAMAARIRKISVCSLIRD